MSIEEESIKYNIVVTGLSCFDGMACSTRVMNLLAPLQNADLISLSNLIYEGDRRGLAESNGILQNISYQIIGWKKSNPFSILSFYWNGMRFLKKNKSGSRKNIIYNYQQVDIKNLIFLIYAKSIGYKIILDLVEEYHFLDHFPNFFNKVKLRSTGFLLKLSPHIADAVLAISTHLFTKLNEICKGKIPVYLIPITVDLMRFNTIEEPLDKGIFKIFYGGSFGKKDGLEYLIDAFDRVSESFDNLQLIFTGKGSETDSARLDKLINSSKFKDKIIHKGFLASDQYYATLNECDIFCMTRVNSSFANAGFPFKLGEFLASGKAVIATRIGDIPNYLTNNVNALLIKPESVDDLANALLTLLNDPSKIYQIGAQGKKIVAEHFDSAVVSKKLLQILKTL